MAQVINVDPQKADDLYYRYKMPSALTKIEGSGNGIKTVFPNIHDICKVIKRPEEILLKFLGNALGAQSTYVKADDKFLVMGQHTQERVQELVFRFIEHYVLCRSCRNPETEVIINKQKVQLVCGACGKKSDVSATDKTANLVVIYYTNLQKEAAKAGGKKADAKPASPNSAATPGTEQAPAAAKTGTAKIQSTAEERENPIDVFGRFLSGGGVTVESATATVFRLKTEYALDERNVVRLVFRAIVQEAEKNAPEGTCPKFIAALRSNLALLKRFADKESAQKVLLREVQLFCHKHSAPEKFMMASKLLVEEGVVADAELFAWYESKAKDVPEAFCNDVKRRSKPFIEWLKPSA